jgi:hypothetical protein
LALITYFVAADEDEFAAVAESMCPLDEWSGIEGKGLDTTKITMLHCLVTGDEYDLSLSLHEPACVAEEGTIVVRIAERVLEKMAAYDAEILSQLADELAATEVFEIEAWPVEAVHTLLIDLAGLARLAESQGQALFAWLYPAPA